MHFGRPNVTGVGGSGDLRFEIGLGRFESKDASPSEFGFGRFEGGEASPSSSEVGALFCEVLA